MKKFLLLLCCHFCLASNAQIHHTLPPEASVFYNEAMQSAKPEIISFIQKKSMQLAGKKVNADSLYLALKNEHGMKNIADADLKTISLLILIKCSYNTDVILKNKVLQIQKQEVAEMNFDGTAQLLEQKSNLAQQASVWFQQINDQTAALKNLQ